MRHASRTLVLAVLGPFLCPCEGHSSNYDLVIHGGRVIDPAHGIDGRRNLGIRDGRIAVVTAQDLTGREELDASGLIVCPGFLDILADGFSREGSRYKIADGVTTQLGMESGPTDVRRFLQSRVAEGVYTNVGAATGHWSIREAVGIDSPGQPAGEEQLSEMRQRAARELAQGALGIGFGIQYTPGASHDELRALFEVASAWSVPCHAHVRWLGCAGEATGLHAVEEVLALAASTGASLQVVHINSMLGTDVARAMDLLDGAARNGVDVAADAYPWTAGMTMLESAVFDPGWRERMGCDYSDLQLEDGSRLTEASFAARRGDDEPTPVIVHFVPSDSVDTAILHPRCLVGSDGGIQNGRGHPRGAGTFARFLRQYAAAGRITWSEALAKITSMPARRLARVSSDIEARGHLGVGAIADIVAFDPETIGERATYSDPAQESRGIEYVLVGGRLVVSRGSVIPDATYGQAILSDRARPPDARLAGFGDVLREQRTRFGNPGISVVVVDHNGTLFQAVAGEADRQTGRLVGPASPFQIGSATKPLTAQVLDHLVRRGFCAWEEPAPKLLPELAGEGGAQGLTLEDLASMRTGYPRTTSLWWNGELSRSELVESLARDQDPGPSRDRFSYQNVCYAALGLAAERQTGLSWETLLRELIFRPAGASIAFDLADAGPRAVRPHRLRENRYEPISHRDLRAIGPAGSVVASADSLGRVLQWLLGDPARRRMLDHQAEARVELPESSPLSPFFPGLSEVTYGLGMFRFEIAGTEVYNHGGGIDGFSSELAILPELGVGFAVLTNAEWDDSFLARATCFELIDRLAENDSGDWFAHFRE